MISSDPLVDLDNQDDDADEDDEEDDEDEEDVPDCFAFLFDFLLYSCIIISFFFSSSSLEEDEDEVEEESALPTLTFPRDIGSILVLTTLLLIFLFSFGLPSEVDADEASDELELLLSTPSCSLVAGLIFIFMILCLIFFDLKSRLGVVLGEDGSLSFLIFSTKSSGDMTVFLTTGILIDPSIEGVLILIVGTRFLRDLVRVKYVLFFLSRRLGSSELDKLSVRALEVR